MFEELLSRTARCCGDGIRSLVVAFYVRESCGILKAGVLWDHVSIRGVEHGPSRIPRIQVRFDSFSFGEKFTLIAYGICST